MVEDGVLSVAFTFSGVGCAAIQMGGAPRACGCGPRADAIGGAAEDDLGAAEVRRRSDRRRSLTHVARAGGRRQTWLLVRGATAAAQAARRRLSRRAAPTLSPNASVAGSPPPALRAGAWSEASNLRVRRGRNVAANARSAEARGRPRGWTRSTSRRRCSTPLCARRSSRLLDDGPLPRRGGVAPRHGAAERAHAREADEEKRRSAGQPTAAERRRTGARRPRAETGLLGRGAWPRPGAAPAERLKTAAAAARGGPDAAAGRRLCEEATRRTARRRRRARLRLRNDADRPRRVFRSPSRPCTRRRRRRPPRGCALIVASCRAPGRRVVVLVAACSPFRPRRPARRSPT